MRYYGHLFENYSIDINFAYRTFIWSNQAKGKAAVHCVIIGFSLFDTKQQKVIYESDDTEILAKNINPYWIEAENVFTRKTSPICNAPVMIFGSMANDGGFLILNEEEKIELINKEPLSEKYIRPFMMGYEFINNVKRYCICLV